MRSYLSWAKINNTQSAADCAIVLRVLDQYENFVLADLQRPEKWMGSLRANSGIEIFALDDSMLGRAVELSTENLELNPFDQAILAAILVRGEKLRDAGADDICFCELDSDLQHWDRNGVMKEPLTSFYNSAHIRVYGDFAFENSSKQPPFPAP